MQHSHSFIFDTKAPISSRSPTDHAEDPCIASWRPSPSRAVEIGAVAVQLDGIG
jgi:hypothetical protein